MFLRFVFFQTSSQNTYPTKGSKYQNYEATLFLGGFGKYLLSLGIPSEKHPNHTLKNFSKRPQNTQKIKLSNTFLRCFGLVLLVSWVFARRYPDPNPPS